MGTPTFRTAAPEPSPRAGMMGITAATIVSLIRDMPDDEAADFIDEYAKTVASCEVVKAAEKIYSRLLGVIEAPTRMSPHA